MGWLGVGHAMYGCCCTPLITLNLNVSFHTGLVPASVAVFVRCLCAPHARTQYGSCRMGRSAGREDGGIRTELQQMCPNAIQHGTQPCGNLGLVSRARERPRICSVPILMKPYPHLHASAACVGHAAIQPTCFPKMSVFLSSLPYSTTMVLLDRMAKSIG